MPNQSDPNSNQPTVPTIFPQSDPLPIPPGNPIVPPTSQPFNQPVGLPPGSSVPPPVPPAVTSSPKKKFGGGRIIATILGIVLLVGAVGAGVVLTGQKQLFQQKAAGTCAAGYTPNQINNECRKDCKNVGAPGADWYWINATQGAACGTGSDGTTKHYCSYLECDTGITTPPTPPNPNTVMFTKAGRLRIYYYDLVSGSSFGKMMMTFTKGGQTSSATLDGGPPGSPTQMEYKDTDISVNAGDSFTVKQYYGPDISYPAYPSYGWINPSGGKCGAHNYSLADVSAQTSYAQSQGEPLVDLECWADANYSGGDTATPDFNDFFIILSYVPAPPTSPPTTPPTLPPTLPPTQPPTAPPAAPQCLNVKAYNANFSPATPLTGAQLSALTPGTVVNFCVAGGATSGSFDQAQFKINATTEPVITIPRQGSTDFCQSYTILSTDTTVNVQAKIHHKESNLWVGESI